MYKATLPMLTLLTALLHTGGAAQAQPAVVDIASDCEGDKPAKLLRAVDGAMRRLNDVDNVLNTAPAEFNSAFAKGFGAREVGSEAEQSAGLLFALFHTNVRALLTNTPGVTIGAGPAPVWPRVSFRCGRFDRANVVAEKIGSEIVLYPVFFDDATVPDTGRYGKVRASRVGLILHESIHLLGGPADIQEEGRTPAVQADLLVRNADIRALSNAENYELFYMSYPFQPL